MSGHCYEALNIEVFLVLQNRKTRANNISKNSQKLDANLSIEIIMKHCLLYLTIISHRIYWGTTRQQNDKRTNVK